MGTVEEATVRAVFGPGVETVVDIGPRTTRPVTGLVDQTKIRAGVKGCRECNGNVELERQPPVYPVLNHAYVRVDSQPMGVGEQRWWNTAMRNAGWKDTRVGLDVAVVQRVACGIGRRPTKDELRSCYGHVIDGMWGANTNFVMLVGGAAKDLWRPDLTMDQLEGTVGVMWDRYITIVVPSPAAVLAMPGGRKKDEKVSTVLGALKLWRELVVGNVRDGKGGEADDPFILPPTTYTARSCVGSGCQRPVRQMDRDGLGWCDKCWDGGGRIGWKVARGVRVDGQGVMF